MENIKITWETIGQLGVVMAAIVGIIKSYQFLRSQTSVAKLEETVKKNTENLDKDFKRLERIDTRIDDIEQKLLQQREDTNEELDKINEGINILGSSMASLINHTIDGSGVDKMREERDKLFGFFIKRE